MIEPELLDAYLKTTYEVYIPGKIIKIRINEYNPDIDTLLKEYDADNWVFITAYNPYSQKLSEEKNILLHNQLLKELSEQNFITFPGSGIPDNNEWSPEISILVLNIPEAELDHLANKYEQNAVVTGIKGGEPTLKLYSKS